MDYLEPPKANFVHVIKSPERQSQRLLLAMKNKLPNTKPAIDWTEFPNIKHMSIPKGWIAKAPYTTPGVIATSMYPVDEKINCGISVSYLCAVIKYPSSRERHYRKQLYRSPSHTLSKDEQEKIPILLNEYSGKSWKTEITSCKTTDWNGQKAIFLEAERPAIDAPPLPPSKLCAIIVDPTGEGYDSVVVKYSAERRLYDKYKKSALKAMHSIEWKPMEKKYADRTDND